MIKIDRLIGIFLVLALGLKGYSIFFLKGVSLGDLFLILGLLNAIFLVHRKNGGLIIEKYSKFFALIIISIIPSLVVKILYGDVNIIIAVIPLVIKLIIVLLTIATIPYVMDFDFFERVFSIFATLNLVYLLIQWAGWYVGDIYFPSIFNIPFFPPTYGDYIDYKMYIDWYHQTVFRAGGLMPEPAMCAFVFIIEYLILAKKEMNGEKLRLRKVMMILGVGLTLSTGGILILAVIIFMEMLQQRKYILLWPIIICVAIWGYVYLKDTTFVTYFITKISNVSASARVGKSISSISEFSLYEKLFGVLSTRESMYLNSFVAFLYWFGILPVIMFLMFCVLIFVKNRDKYKGVSIAYFMKAVSSGAVFNSFGIMLLLVFYGNGDKNELLIEHSDSDKESI